MGSLFKSKGAIGQAFARAREAQQGSRPHTGIDPAAPGVDRSQLPAEAGSIDDNTEGRRRRGRGQGLGGRRKGLGAQSVLTSTY